MTGKKAVLKIKRKQKMKSDQVKIYHQARHFYDKHDKKVIQKKCTPRSDALLQDPDALIS